MINGAGELTEGLTVELYDPSDCEDEDYIFTSNNLPFGDYAVFTNVSVAEWVAMVIEPRETLHNTVRLIDSSESNVNHGS